MHTYTNTHANKLEEVVAQKLVTQIRNIIFSLITIDVCTYVRTVCMYVCMGVFPRTIAIAGALVREGGGGARPGNLG